MIATFFLYLLLLDDRHINKNCFDKKTLIWRNPMAATGLPPIPRSRAAAAPAVPVHSAP
jgi:hypothetical protein